jgi:hypothetical protein
VHTPDPSWGWKHISIQVSILIWIRLRANMEWGTHQHWFWLHA